MDKPLDLTHARKDFELAIRQDERRQCMARLSATKLILWDAPSEHMAIRAAIMNEPGA